jgi:thioredoxin reductase
MASNNNFDVIIIGGSYSGLSAAMTLGRSLRKVLVIDSGLPCNRQTPHSHNFLTQDGQTPYEIAALAKAQVEKYSTVAFYNGTAITGAKTKQGFEITTQTGDAFSAKKLIFATGIKDLLPDIEGFAACWGISVIHCPYCHGFEFRSQKTAILANGDRAMHLASLVHNLSKDLVILTSGDAGFDGEQAAALKKNHVKVIETEVAEIEHKNGHVNKVIFKNGSTLSMDAIYAAVPFVQHSDIPGKLGCELTEQGYLQVNAFQQTSVPGIFASGDCTIFMRSVANAVASGNFAGAMVNKELCDEEFRTDDALSE